MEAPLALSRNAAQLVQDLFYFRRNAAQNAELRRSLAGVATGRFHAEELRLENERLARLIGLRTVFPKNITRTLYARVVGRSPLAWNRVLLVDKGFGEGVKIGMPVMSDLSLIGKVVEAGPSVAKVLLITDPNSKVGVLIQRTRQQGVLFGTVSGECRVKYLSVEVPVKAGDLVETAGHGGLVPKGLPVGRVQKVWKEPGQIYQVARIKPITDLGRLEEVACVE
jgi:rod shape-determining protein MreC